MKSALLVTLVSAVLLSTSVASSAPRPKQDSGRYDLDLLGFNDGVPYRLEGAAAEAVLAEKGAAVFRFDNKDWMNPSGEGAYVPVSEVVSRFPGRTAGEMVAVYRMDLDGDSAMDVLLVPDNVKLAGKRRYAPTVLRMSGEGYEPVWATSKLPGKRFRVVDARDLNRDGRPELLLVGKLGRWGFTIFISSSGRAGVVYRV